MEDQEGECAVVLVAKQARNVPATRSFLKAHVDLGEHGGRKYLTQQQQTPTVSSSNPEFSTTLRFVWFDD